MSRRRLDEEIAGRGLLPSRARARDAVLRGTVFVNGAPARRPSQFVGADDAIALTDKARPYVSRAALKLLHGLDHFEIGVEGRVCLDVGASAGGFTQVLLERGAQHVTAIDVGHGQIADKLLQDRRVTMFERLNVRDMSHKEFPPGCTLIVCDVSFISLEVALPKVLSLAERGTELVAVIKPQFEAGKDRIGKGGIVSDPALHREICKNVSDFLALNGWTVTGIESSPVEGGDGNKEFLIGARKS